MYIYIYIYIHILNTCICNENKAWGISINCQLCCLPIAAWNEPCVQCYNYGISEPQGMAMIWGWCVFTCCLGLMGHREY